MINIIINGCNGKMGQVVASSALSDPEVNIVAGVDRFPESMENPFPVYKNFSDIKEKADVVIDFSVPAALPALLEYAVNANTPVVIATTGFSEQDLALIEQTSTKIPLFRAANMSIGINLMYELVQKAASVLGEGFDIEIIEKHHNQKIDSPSGTALALADSINEAFLNAKNYVYGRHSKNDRRTAHEIGIHAIRGGTISGDHTVIYAGKDEILEITHSAHSKQIFATGAIAAAKYMSDKQPGLYNMKDILLEQCIVTNIYTDNDEAMITVNNLPNDSSIIYNIFGKLAQENINVDMISQTAPVNGQVNVSFTIPEKELNEAINVLGVYNKVDPSIRTDVLIGITKLTVEGLGMERQSGVAAKVFETMARQDIKIKLITTSETKISCVIDSVDEKHAVEGIMSAFNL